MIDVPTRRRFLKTAVMAGATVGLGDFSFLRGLPRVAAEEARLDSKMVRFHPDIEPLVRFLEETPRERLLEEVATRIHHGLTYRELLAALLLAGVRNIQPRPVGFKFHAVLVVNSAHRPMNPKFPRRARPSRHLWRQWTTGMNLPRIPQ